MRYTLFLLCFLTAVFFTIYPIIGRISGVSANWMRTVISSTTLATILVLQLRGAYGPIPNGNQLLLVLLSGILAGIGAYFFGKLVAIETSIGMAVSIPLISTIVILLNGAISNIFLHEIITWRMVVGYVLGCASIWLIAWKE